MCNGGIIRGKGGRDEGLREGARDLVGVEAVFFIWVFVQSRGAVDAERSRRRRRGGVIGRRGKKASLLGAKKVLLHFDDGELASPGDPASDNL